MLVLVLISLYAVVPVVAVLTGGFWQYSRTTLILTMLNGCSTAKLSSQLHFLLDTPFTGDRDLGLFQRWNSFFILSRVNLAYHF